jgi:hypothetical protein
MLHMKVRDYFIQGHRGWVNLYEKNGEEHEVRCQRNQERLHADYLVTASIAGDRKRSLFRTGASKTGVRRVHAIWQHGAYQMIQWRAAVADIKTSDTKPHPLRDRHNRVPENSDKLELEQHITNQCLENGLEKHQFLTLGF